MKKPGQPVAWGRVCRACWRFAVLAALVTVAVLALLPPREVPPPVSPDRGLAARLSGLLDDASSATQPRAFAVPASDVNRWLVSTVRLEEGDDLLKLRPERLYAVPGDGRVRLGLEAALPWGWRIYFEGDYAPVQGASGYMLQPLGYAIGRLPVPVLLGWPVRRQFEELGRELRVPLEQLSRASYIGVDPETVTLRWSDSRR